MRGMHKRGQPDRAGCFARREGGRMILSCCEFRADQVPAPVQIALSFPRASVCRGRHRLMDPAEYTNLEQVEGAHWFYAGKREIARRWLFRVRTLRPDDLLRSEEHTSELQS